MPPLRVSPAAATAPAPVDGQALRRSGAALVVVGVLFVLLQRLFLPADMGLSVDEATYLAKVDPDAPELYWTEVRAWGMPLLAAPVAVFSPGTGVVRAWFSLLSGAGLVAAFWPWRHVLPPAVAPLAALLFATCWYSLQYGMMLFPNLYVALGAVATTGLFLRAVQSGRRRHLLLAGAAAALVALVRPSDSVLLLIGVGACALAAPRLRRPRQLGALVAGVLLGWLPWLVEAYLRFGGPLSRLRGGNEAGLQGGVTLNSTNAQTYLRLLDGRPTYCCFGAPATEAGPLPVLLSAWSLGLLVLALVGVAVAARQRRLPEVAVAVVPAIVLAAFYLLLLPFGSARFLLPITALLALPLAAGLVALASGRHRSVGTVLVVALVAGHLGLMLRTASRVLPGVAEHREGNVRVAAALRPLVTTRPCVVIGRQPQVRAYYLGCRPERWRGAPAQPPRRVTSALEQGGTVVAVLSAPAPRGSYLASWRLVRVPGVRGSVYLAPDAPAR